MATIRVARTAADTLSHVFYAADGETPVDPSAATCTIVDATGTEIADDTADITGGATGEVTFDLDPQTDLATLTVTWTATVSGTSVTETDTVEIVGGFLFGLAEGRASDSSLADTTKYPAADLRLIRQEVEEECEQICLQAWVPRYRRVTLDGTGTTRLLLPDGGDLVRGGIVLRGVRSIRSASIAPRVGQTFVDLDVDELAALTVTADGELLRVDGQTWTEGVRNVVLELEYGQDAPPSDLKKAAMMRFRSRLNLTKSGIPDRATSFTATDGGTYRIDLPDAYKVGIPDIDAVYGRYSRRSGAGTGQGGKVPASRTLSYDVQRTSLFHRAAR